MMLAFDVRPTNESIRKGLKQHSIRGSHNDRQRCKVSKCSRADIARGGLDLIAPVKVPEVGANVFTVKIL